MNVGVFNARSLCNKTVAIFESLSDLDVDVCFLSETWLRRGDSSKVSEIKDLGYNIKHVSRQGRGGGVAIAYKKNMMVTKNSTKMYKSFEHIECTMKSTSNEVLTIVCLYRSCTASNANVSDFCNEFDQYMS